jgi:hypothetical protein
MVIWLGLPHYPHQAVVIGWLCWSTLRLYDSWKTAQVFGVLPNLLCVLRMLCTLWIFSVCICVFFSFLGLVLFDPCSFGPTMMESQETHGKLRQWRPLKVSWVLMKNMFQTTGFAITVVESKKKRSNYPGWSRGLNWRKGNTENDDADGGHDNEQKDDHDEEHEDRNHLTIAIESHHISACCCADDFIDPCQNNSHMSMTPNYQHHPSIPKKMDRYSVWVPTKIQCLSFF